MNDRFQHLLERLEEMGRRVGSRGGDRLRSTGLRGVGFAGGMGIALHPPGNVGRAEDVPTSYGGARAGDASCSSVAHGWSRFIATP